MIVNARFASYMPDGEDVVLRMVRVHTILNHIAPWEKYTDYTNLRRAYNRLKISPSETKEDIDIAMNFNIVNRDLPVRYQKPVVFVRTHTTRYNLKLPYTVFIR